MSKKSIPEEIKKEADKIVADFNRKRLKDPNYYYVTRYQGAHLYLDRYDYGGISQICRLTYTGDMNDWDFAIFKYSDMRYDPDEWMFPGSGHVDGTIEGAMKAGIEAYP